MKNEFDHKLDQLLRRHHTAARRADLRSARESGSSSEVAANQASTSAHLDADEFNAYLQLALPDASRLRLTAHLADCNACRQNITLLARETLDHAPQAIVNEEAAPDEERQTGVVALPVATWQERFVALFRTPGYAYALPAVALLITACVALLIYSRTSHDGGNQIVVLTDTTQKQAADANYDLSHANGNNLPPTNANATNSNAAATGQTNNVPENTAPVQTTVENKNTETGGDTGSNNQNVDGNQPSYANNERAQTPAALNTNNNARTPEAPPQGESEISRAQVAGRRFTRQRGVWTDRSYTSAQQTFIVTRDSEQYRALVADEPSIGRIAEQLNGEVVVVVKNSAYRIR